MTDLVFSITQIAVLLVAGFAGYLYRRFKGPMHRRLVGFGIMFFPLLVAVIISLSPDEEPAAGEFFTPNEIVWILILAYTPAWAFGFLTGYMLKSQVVRSAGH